MYKNILLLIHGSLLVDIVWNRNISIRCVVFIAYYCLLFPLCYLFSVSILGIVVSSTSIITMCVPHCFQCGVRYFLWPDSQTLLHVYSAHFFWPYFVSVKLLLFHQFPCSLETNLKFCLTTARHLFFLYPHVLQFGSFCRNFTLTSVLFVMSVLLICDFVIASEVRFCCLYWKFRVCPLSYTGTRFKSRRQKWAAQNEVWWVTSFTVLK